MCVLTNLEYLSILFCAVLWAAALGLVAVLPMWYSAYVSGTVTSQAVGLMTVTASSPHTHLTSLVRDYPGEPVPER